jgi:hypothetical protein
MRRRRALAIAWALTCGAVARAASAQVAAPPPPGCTLALKDVRTGSGTKSFASHYVTVDGYGYGEFAAGGFGGQSLWQKRGSLWCRVATGAAPLDGAALRTFGVPAATADRLIARMHADGREIAPVAPPQVHHR